MTWWKLPAGLPAARMPASSRSRFQAKLMSIIEWTWKSRDGLELAGRGWTVENPKAIVCLVHGHGEHTGRYRHVGEALAKAGYILLGFDLRGHGLSGGQRGHSPSDESLLD